MKNPMWWVVVALGVAGVAAISYHWWQKQPQEPQPPLPARSETQPAPSAKIEPSIRYPIEGLGEPDKEAKPLPPLNESDAAMRESLAGIIGQKSLADFFYPDGIVRRIVATVDNLPREKVAARLMPVKPAAGKFFPGGQGESLVLNPSNYSRYAPYVRVAEAVDAKKLVAVYVRFYPLFQQAYKDLGYPSGYFNDRLVEVIDHLLAAPEVQGPLKLVRPKVLYEFADPKLEALSAGQKVMIRMGPENAATVKAKLREIRRELTGQVPQQ